MNELISERMNERMSGWVDEWMNEWMKCVLVFNIYCIYSSLLNIKNITILEKGTKITL